MLFESDGLNIEIYDRASTRQFIKIHMNPNEVTQALGRLCHTECEMAEVFSLDKVGKTMEHKKLRFRMPECDYKEREKVAIKLAEKNCPEGWESDNYFNSQDSFFKKGETTMAQTTIRRYVDKCAEKME